MVKKNYKITLNAYTTSGTKVVTYKVKNQSSKEQAITNLALFLKNKIEGLLVFELIDIQIDEGVGFDRKFGNQFLDEFFNGFGGNKY
jgi:hypothetical protein